MSWLVREAESRDDLLVTRRPTSSAAKGCYVALPLRRENSALAGFLVLHSPSALRRHVATALNSSLDAIGLALAPRPAEAAPVEIAAATGS